MKDDIEVGYSSNLRGGDDVRCVCAESIVGCLKKALLSQNDCLASSRCLVSLLSSAMSANSVDESCRRRSVLYTSTDVVMF